MISVSQTLMDTITGSVELKISPVVIAEWELNAFYDASASGSESFNDDLYPLDSVILPRRPEKTGLPKARLGSSKVKSANNWPKYRAGTDTSAYKYYRMNDPTFGDAAIEITYSESAQCNKMFIVFEQSNIITESVELHIDTGSGFTSIGTFVPDADGVIEIYRQSNGTWSTTENFDDPIGIVAVRTDGFQASGVDNDVEIIQISPRLVNDISDDVINVGVNSSRNESNINSPRGIYQSGVCEIELDNTGGKYDNNGGGVYDGLIDRNVIFHVYQRVLRSDLVEEDVPMGKFFADEWSIGSEGVVSVSATDRSKFFQESIVPEALYTGVAIPIIARDIIEKVGWNRVSFDIDAGDLQINVPYIWFDDDITLWQALEELALADGASFFFDESDTFVWRSRSYDWENQVINTALRADASGGELANIVELNQDHTIGANHVVVKYTPLEDTKNNAGNNVNNILWEETSPVALNAAPLQIDVAASGAADIYLPDDEGEFWRDEGIILVDQEYMRYTSKTGDILHVPSDGRGVFESTITDHTIDPTGDWEVYSSDGTQQINVHNVVFEDSVAKVSVNAGSGVDAPYSMAFVRNGLTTDSFALYGCHLFYPSVTGPDGTPAYPDERSYAGMTFHHGGEYASRRAYFIEVVLSSHRQFGFGEHRGYEVRAYKMSGQTLTTLAVANFTIIPGKDYVLEVVANGDTYSVYINGTSVTSFTDSSYSTGRWGLFARRIATVHSDFFYVINNLTNDELPAPSQFRVKNRVDSGYVSNYVIYNSPNGKPWNVGRKLWEALFDDFGAYVREGREYSIKYDLAPALVSNLYVSNDDNVAVPRNNSNPFGGEFVIVNTNRTTTIANGEDSFVIDDKSVQQELLYLGIPIIEGEERAVTFKDQPSINRRGTEELEVASPWIQTEDQANDLGQHFIDRWGTPLDLIDVETIINPSIQPGDIVEVYYSERNLSGEKFHVLSVENEFGASHSQSLRLRRAYV